MNKISARSPDAAATRPSDSTDGDAAQLALLRLLNERPDLSQRELSVALKLSLGKTHYVLHALLDRGLVKARNFRRNNNKLAYSYLLTPAGIREKLSMTKRFLVHKEAEFEQLQLAIARLRAEVANTPSLDSAECPTGNRHDLTE